MSVFRIYVEKKSPYATLARTTFTDAKTALKLDSLEGLHILNRYDVEGLSEDEFQLAVPTVFSEPAVDDIYMTLPISYQNKHVFAIEYLPGQFDQRADSCEQCIQLLTQGERCHVRNARVFVADGDLSGSELNKLKRYLINPVESREASLSDVDTLEVSYEIPKDVATLDGFIMLDEAGLKALISDYALAMDLDDIKCCQKYFADTEKRDPTITEVRMIDTYWSDHCRHTTFATHIDNVKIDADYIAKTYDEYIAARKQLEREDRPITLMDLGTIGAKKLKADGLLKELDASEEINACSVKIKVDVDGVNENWLLMFKNETHNHPTEIEPFGGAATCLGGAIRDPLSGRSYVYQAMRVTGAANPLVPVEDTVHGKLPQRKITVGAANGYSSYGNQIGLATGSVTEIYHPGYVAKRMEIGAVIGAAPLKNVRREAPKPSDIVILLGGKTGRDGCGGATGSSKSHTEGSLETCGAEVQKGNAPVERKIQRLFRNGEVTRLIKRCNDFGAGGVAVAIGELTDGLIINLDKIPKKYNGLDGTELAISESQERMAVVVSKKDAPKFLEEAAKENLEATLVAIVTKEPRLKMMWNEKEIVNLSREFLNSNGAEKHASVSVAVPILNTPKQYFDRADSWVSLMSNLNICSQKGLVERFDSTIGSGTILMPYGGAWQMTPTQAMAAKIPVMHGETTTCSIMGWGFNPTISDKSPYHGAMLAVIESIAKVVAIGGSHKKCWLSFQEYFERTQDNPTRWGKPFAALLGAYKAQIELGCGAIGGKDSMSGTFENIDVPPTLVSFAVSMAKSEKIISPEFKQIGSRVILIKPSYNENYIPNFDSVKACFSQVEKLIAEGKATAVWALTTGGVAEAVVKMAFGNKIGFTFTEKLDERVLFSPIYGGFVVELSADAEVSADEEIIGHTNIDYEVDCMSYRVSLEELQKSFEDRLQAVYPTTLKIQNTAAKIFTHTTNFRPAPAISVAKPRVIIPVFPGTNCEDDSARAFEKAGAIPEVFIINNLSSAAVAESILKMEKLIKNSQIIMLPGGFSGGDEPDGSAKFIAAFFRNPRIKDAVEELLEKRDGLMLGICNGFQALVKLGLVPYGKIVDMRSDSPTLTFNSIGRHQSMMVTTRVASNKSPWLTRLEVGSLQNIVISHGEGRFVATPELITSMAAAGQIATQYVNENGEPTLDIRFNPNTSMEAIEGITSPDGRIFGKMGHSERIGRDICKNIPGKKNQHLFSSGVKYFID